MTSAIASAIPVQICIPQLLRVPWIICAIPAPLRAHLAPLGTRRAMTGTTVLAEVVGCAFLLQLDFCVQPRLELLCGLNGDKSAHPGVADSAELCAGDLVLELSVPRLRPHVRGGDGRNEPDGNCEAGNGVLFHAK